MVTNSGNGSGGYAFGEYGGSGLHGVAASNYVEADDKGYGKASNTAEGSTSGELYLQSGSKAVGGTGELIFILQLRNGILEFFVSISTQIEGHTQSY